jgi:NAD(P)-dependent dehydrogenase (short-subunit alcohol dehydrogenase family)
MAELDQLQGGWALVTGAGDGIGRSLALGFAKRGLDVVVLDILRNTADAVAEEVRAIGVKAISETVDVSDPEALSACADRLAQDGIELSLLWINAGVGVGATLLEGSRSAIEWAVTVNILSVAWTARAFVPLLRQRAGAAHVGVTASSASITDVEGPYTLYAATKHGTAAFAEALTAELAPRGVGVTILYPGLVNTRIWDAARARPDRYGGARLMPDEAGTRWRAAPSPDVLILPVMATIERGGGRCVVDVERRAGALFEERTAAIKAGFADWEQT